MRLKLLTIKHGNSRMGALMEMHCNVKGLSTPLNISRKCCRPDVRSRQWGRTAVGSRRVRADDGGGEPLLGVIAAKLRMP